MKIKPSVKLTREEIEFFKNKEIFNTLEKKSIKVVYNKNNLSYKKLKKLKLIVFDLIQSL